MKETTGDPRNTARPAWHASIVLLASALVALAGVIPAQASAITRTTVLDRAHA